MFLVVEENDNSRAEERVFQESGPIKEVAQIQVETPTRGLMWCDVIGVDEAGTFSPAKAVLVDDSGAGTAYLVFGEMWGIRLRPAGSNKPWALAEPTQWGEPFKVMDSSGQDIRFKR